MSRQSKAQKEFLRDLRTHNSIRYAARTTVPNRLQNIYIITKTMAYNNLSDDQDSAEAGRVKIYNSVLLVFTVAFELMVLSMRFLGFFFSLGSGKKGRRRW